MNRLRQMVVRLSRLVEISVTLNSTLELDRLLQFIIRSAADLVESEAASILLVSDKTRDLYIAAATDIDPETLQKIPVPKEGSIAGTIFREDRPLILNELGTTAQIYPEVGEGGSFSVNSLIGVPLRIRDEVTGVLEAVNKRQGIFDEADLQTLTNIASLAAVAISNARQIEALNRTYEALGKLDQLKTDFIAIASHELRTPLGLILGNASLLKELTGEDVSEHADAVLNSALRMRVLIEDMTNLNMLQAGSADLALSKQPLQFIVQMAYEEILGLVEAREQTIKLNLPTETLEAMVDGSKITMALTNLLNNAIRFTPKEGELRLTLEHHGHEAWLRVRDDGIGLAPDELETVFDLFYQVEDHLTRQHDGLGLGLPIVKAIAESHGGRVWVESEGPDQGATFTIALPLES
ncbi:MAG TPA: ATP-binding protein [Anaerolineales bacterium]|nr:ATP-binding protein [Anaerolineales bacterium]